MFVHDDLEIIASLHTLLMNVTLDTLTDSVTELLKLPFTKTIEGVERIASAILIAANARPLNIAILAQFSHALCNAASSDNTLSDLKLQLMKALIKKIGYSHCFPHEASAFAFFFQAYKHKVFRKEDILSTVQTLTKLSTYIQANCWLLTYFAPELEAIDPKVFQELIEMLHINSKFQHFPRIFKNFSEQLVRLQAQNWMALKKEREFFSTTETLESQIRDDNVDALISSLQSPSITINTRIPQTPFLPSAALFGHPTIIQVAAFFGSVRCFRWLLCVGADLLAIDNNFMTLPQLAVAGGNLEIIRFCQHYNLDFSATTHPATKYHHLDLSEWLIAFDPLALDRDIFGRTPLHYACLSDNICEVVRLMAAGINPNVADHNHSTPLRVAVRRGNLAALTCLLSHSELDLNPRGPNNLTPLSVAAKHGEITMARMLVARGARIDDVWGEGRTPLLIATEHRQYAMVKWLLSQPDINPNACRSDGVTSLLGTACAGWEAIAELFVDHPNIDVNATTANKNTALFYATRNGSRQLFKKLIAHRDIDLTIVGVGGTLLHAAVQHIDLLRILLTKRVIDVNAINCHGETALHRAATAGYDAAIAELLAVPEIDPNICTKRGDTALHRALAGRHSDVAERIVCFEKTDINKHTGNWASPLSLAIMWKMPTVAKILLQRSDIEIRGQVGVKNSWPPLTIAANYGNREIMELLLARPGVDLTDDKYGVKAAFTITMKHGFTECVQLLQTIWKARRIPKKKQQKRSGFFKRFCRRKKTMNV